MKIFFIPLLLFSSIISGHNPVNSWVNYNLLPDTIRIKDKKRAPDQNSYKWIKYIEKQCGDIRLNSHIVANNDYYQAIIKRNTLQTKKELSRFIKPTAKLLLSGALYLLGTSLLGFICNEFNRPLPHKRIKKNDDFIAAAGSAVTTAIFCYVIGTIIAYKTIKKRLKLKKTLKRNTKMLNALESIAK